MHVRTIPQCPNYLKTKLNPAQYSEQSSRSVASLIKTNRKCKCMDHESKGKMYLSKIKHFDDMALSRVKKNSNSLCGSRKDSYIGAARYCRNP